MISIITKKANIMEMSSSESEQSNTNFLQHQSHIIRNNGFNLVSFSCLKSAIDLEIPDIIHNHGGPMTLSELIKALPAVNKAKSNCISRLMSMLVHSGFFVEEEKEGEECYSFTPITLSMRSGRFQSMFNPVMLSAWLHMGEWFTNDDSTPFQTAHGMPFWDYMAQDTNFNDFFNNLMSRDAREVAMMVVRDCQGAFEGLNSVVDVGGGTGTLAKALAANFPHIKCINFDLPHVVAGLEDSTNLTHVEGDMFLAIPPADVVILKWIMHDWSDEECVKILKRCKEAIPSREKGGKLMIIDMVVKEKKDDNGGSKREEAILYDMRMMVCTTGKERNEMDWAKLFVDSGFSDYKIMPIDLGLKSLIEVYP